MQTKTIFWVANVPLLQHVQKMSPESEGGNLEIGHDFSRNLTSESLSRSAVCRCRMHQLWQIFPI